MIWSHVSRIGVLTLSPTGLNLDNRTYHARVPIHTLVQESRWRRWFVREVERTCRHSPRCVFVWPDDE